MSLTKQGRLLLYDIFDSAYPIVSLKKTSGSIDEKFSEAQIESCIILLLCRDILRIIHYAVFRKKINEAGVKIGL